MSDRQFRGSGVEVRNGDIDGALRRLKRNLIKEGWAKDIAKTVAYEKPSEARKRTDLNNRKTINKSRQIAESKGDLVVRRSGLKHLKSKRTRNVEKLKNERIDRESRRLGS
jgi:ribosomal protein S21